jgi:polysaccharide export outer membrane protein
VEYIGSMQKTFSSAFCWLAILGFACFALVGCANKPLSVPYSPSNFGPPDPQPVAPVSDVIGPGDKIHVTVFNVDSLSGDYQVEQNGQIDYPLIGDIQVEGHTASDLAKILASRLGERNLNNPNVQVSITAHAPQTITVEGAVNQPGMVEIPGDIGLLQAIALGRGTSEDADPSQVVVFRKVGGQRMAAAFDLRAIRRDEAPDPPIYPNDIVVVAGSKNRKLVDHILQALPVLGIFRPF